MFTLTRTCATTGALLCVAALAACSSDKPSGPSSARLSPGIGSGSSSSSSSSTAAMSQDAAKTALAQRSQSKVLAVVAVGTGYEGATADASTMHFWKSDASGSWTPEGTVARLPVFSPSVEQKIEGHRIKGSDHAVFILQAPMGGTGSSPTAQAFAYGSHGWGGIAATKEDGSAVAITSNPGGAGAWHSASFHDDTVALGTFVPGIANADGHDVTRSWEMSGDQLRLVSTDDPSTKPQNFTAGAWSRFTSPSGKNYCEISTDTVTCTLSEAVASTHGGSNLVRLDSSGWTLGMGDPGIGESMDGEMWATTGGGATPDQIDGTRILNYGSTLRGGTVTCKSSQNGFTCSTGAASFTVNSQSLSTQGRHGADPESDS